jgi:hypothetical protein
MLNVSNLRKGTYVVKVYNKNGNCGTQMIIVK